MLCEKKYILLSQLKASLSLNNLPQIVRLVVLMKEYMRIYGRLTVNSFALRVDNNGEEENIGTGFITFFYKKNGIVSILGREYSFIIFVLREDTSICTGHYIKNNVICIFMSDYQYVVLYCFFAMERY